MQQNISKCIQENEIYINRRFSFKIDVWRAITLREERMIRHEKHGITRNLNVSSINSPSRTLACNILLNGLKELPGHTDTHLPNSINREDINYNQNNTLQSSSRTSNICCKTFI